MTPEALIAELKTLRVQRRLGSKARHQPISLIWAMSRKPRGSTRLATWTEFRDEVTPLLSEFGGNDYAPTAHFPFWHLARTVLWEVQGFRAPDAFKPRADSFDGLDVRGGLSVAAWDALSIDPNLIHRAQFVLSEWYDLPDMRGSRQAVGLEH